MFPCTASGKNFPNLHKMSSPSSIKNIENILDLREIESLDIVWPTQKMEIMIGANPNKLIKVCHCPH